MSERIDRAVLDYFSASLNSLDSLKSKIPRHCTWVIDSIEKAKRELRGTMMSVDSVTRDQRTQRKTQRNER
jgi:hypothetical protein